MTRAPGPKGTLVWGSLAAFQQDALGLLSDAVRDHGDILRLRFGPVVAHLINHPDHIEQVLSRNARNYDKNTRSAARISDTCGDSLLSGNQDAWQRHRRLIQPVFQPRFFADINASVDARMAPMLDRWAQVADQGGTIDIAAEMMHLVIGIAAKTLFSTDVDTDRIETALAVILADTWRRLQAPLDPSMLSSALHRRAFKQALGTIDQIVFELIRDRRNASDRPDDVLSRLLDAHETEGDAQLSDRELRDAAVTLLLAGHETTANALAWAFWRAADGFEDANPAQIFTEAVRLYPSIWIIERRALSDDQIGPYHIPRGSSVLISPYLLHRHSAFWPDAERFDPARFDHEMTDTRPRHACMPFGLGPHRCVGLHMANAIATRVITRVYEQFRLHPNPGPTPDLSPGITLRPAGPLPMSVKKLS